MLTDPEVWDIKTRSPVLNPLYRAPFQPGTPVRHIQLWERARNEMYQRAVETDAMINHIRSYFRERNA